MTLTYISQCKSCIYSAFTKVDIVRKNSNRLAVVTLKCEILFFFFLFSKLFNIGKLKIVHN